jgi:RNA polymerase I-specific transcription-initiation factor
MSISDPYPLLIPEISRHELKPPCSPNDVLLSSLLFKQARQATLGSDHIRSPLSRQAKLFVLYTDLSVREYLYVESKTGEHMQQGGPEVIQDVLPLKKRSIKSRKSGRRVIEDDDFIVHDWDDLLYPLPTLGCQNALTPSSTAPSPSRRWPIDFTAVYSAAAGKTVTHPRSNIFRQVCQKPFNDCLRDLEKKIFDYVVRAPIASPQTM